MHWMDQIANTTIPKFISGIFTLVDFTIDNIGLVSKQVAIIMDLDRSMD